MKQHLDRGVAAYASKQYEQAIQEFSAAYAIEPRPDILFAWAQAERLSGNCQRAIELYVRFLETDPPPAERDQTTEQLSRCQRAIATAPPPTREAPPPPDARPAQPVAAPKASADRSPWYSDPIGDTLVIGGIAALGVGTGFLIAAAASDAAARNDAKYADFLQHVDAAHTRRVIGAIGVGAGAAILTLGVVRFATRRRRAPSAARVGITIGSTLRVTGSF